MNNKNNNIGVYEYEYIGVYDYEYIRVYEKWKK
jgi:hypothetical protein